MRNFHLPGRSPVYAHRAMCATSHPLASEAAIRVLRSGGNAVDAAITATAVLCVVEPAMTGIGGDCFAILRKPDGRLIGLNAAGRAPAAATAGWYAERRIRAIEQTSPHAVTVPGALRGWAKLLADHGTRSLAECLAPAIEHAGEGFPVGARVAHDWAGLVPKLEKNAGARRHLLIEGRAPGVGERMRMPALAASLRKIARDGADAFYVGELAEDMVRDLRELGGLHTLADFAAQDAEYVTPISSGYRGVTLHELPPSNQGIVALIVLKLLDRLGPLGRDPVSPERVHVTLEVARLAYAVRDRFVADPAQADVPVNHMLSDDLIGSLAGRIDRKRRNPDLGPIPEPKGSDTIYMTVVDETGMAVSFINSLFAGFGSGIVARQSGITLQNRGQGFVLEPGHRNCIAPRKKPMHTLVPAVATEGADLWATFGVMGGAYQPFGHAWVLSNMVDYGLDPQEAVDCPRAFFEGQMVQVEDGFTSACRAALEAMGHRIERRPDPWGGGQLIRYDAAQRTYIGASDPRKDGQAIGY